MKKRSERVAHPTGGSWARCVLRLVQGVKDEAQDALRPRCPAEEAINSNRRTGVQREKGLSLQPLNGARQKKGLSLQPPDEAANEGLNHSVHRPALRAKGLSLRIGSVPSWATFRCNPG